MTARFLQFQRYSDDYSIAVSDHSIPTRSSEGSKWVCYTFNFDGNDNFMWLSVEHQNSLPNGNRTYRDINKIPAKMAHLLPFAKQIYNDNFRSTDGWVAWNGTDKYNNQDYQKVEVIGGIV